MAPELRSLRQHSVLLASSLATPPATDDPTCPRLSVTVAAARAWPATASGHPGAPTPPSHSPRAQRELLQLPLRPVRAPAGGASTTGDRLHPLVRLSRASDTQLRQCWGCSGGDLEDSAANLSLYDC